MTTQKWGRVRDCMKPGFTEVDGKMDVLSAMKVMKEVGATSLLVKPERVNVYEIMAKPVVTVKPDMHIRYCARLFENFGIGHAPVEEDGKIIGIVSYYRLVLYGLKDLIDD